jgi:hypothetical protein
MTLRPKHLFFPRRAIFRELPEARTSMSFTLREAGLKEGKVIYKESGNIIVASCNQQCEPVEIFFFRYLDTLMLNHMLPSKGLPI